MGFSTTESSFSSYLHYGRSRWRPWLHFAESRLPFGQEHARLSNPFWISSRLASRRRQARPAATAFFLVEVTDELGIIISRQLASSRKAKGFWVLDLVAWLTTVEVVVLLSDLFPQESQMIHIAIDDNSTAIFHQETFVVEIVFEGWCSIGPIWSGLMLRKTPTSKVRP